MREKTVEQYLTKQARALGGDSYKLAPTHIGMPDRMVLLPGGILALVELKAPQGRLRPAQVVWHQRALEKGTKVHVCYTREQVDLLLKELTDNGND